MRREGRMHGSYIRESKHSAAWPGVKASTKPTNHTKCTGKCGNNGRARCKCCAFALPIDKSLNKTKGNVKAKAFNITSNYKMQEWRVCDSSPPSSSSKRPILKVERPLCAWDQYANLDYQQSDSECDEESQVDNDVDDQEDEVPNSWTSEIVLPIESLLRARKIREIVPDSVSESVGEEEDEEEEGSTNDSDDSWSGVDLSEVDNDMSDGDESWADDWSLVEEAL